MRLLVAALMLANVLVAAWLLGWIGPGNREREPERVAAQANTQAVEVLGASAAGAAATTAAAPAAPTTGAPTPRTTTASPAAPASAPDAAPDAAASAPVAERVACLEAGPFAAGELAVAERNLRELQVPGLAWTPQKIERGGSFIVYQGRFADDAAYARGKNELRRAQIPFDEVRNSPELEPGLSLGRHDSRAAAEAALEQLRNRGVKAARLVMINAPVTVTMLRVERVEPALAQRLTQLALPPLGAGFKACASGG
ncbi:MAG: hypothetical protein U1E89_08470 [Burkholderiaceae bacterium]